MTDLSTPSFHVFAANFGCEAQCNDLVKSLTDLGFDAELNSSNGVKVCDLTHDEFQKFVMAVAQSADHHWIEYSIQITHA